MKFYEVASTVHFVITREDNHDQNKTGGTRRSNEHQEGNDSEPESSVADRHLLR
eukprot:CAMPEP_0184496084 /NCGR_PEP_ID=MMETSP0113_2-20130426/33098_1 /TAXON_ID=91329 /ORGANISM="Norrisiella sphaerica, Strain BC52" /LENGTH=53 /DNA_ID=CAMNT_0026882577 /DNA_START=126 /DNA_END=284 /DNA_ORIENTATION=+